MAHAPKPTGVMDKSELPSCFVFMPIFVIGLVFVFLVFMFRSLLLSMTDLVNLMSLFVFSDLK